MGDQVWSRTEFDPNGPLELKVVEERFVRLGKIMHLHVGGQVIRTTAEHPFYVWEKGWTAAGQLEVGDLLASHNGKWVAVEDVLETGECEPVYNVRISDFHTYFVGSSDWRFSVWAHNAECVFNWGDEALEPFAHLRGKMEQAAKANDPKLINEVATEIQQIALERSASMRWQTGETSLQNGLSKFYEVLDTHNSSYAIEYQPGFKLAGKVKGVEIWKRTTETAEQLRARSGSFEGTLWPDVVVTDLRGTARPVMERGLLTPEMSLQMSNKTKIVAVSDISQKSVGTVLTDTTKPLIFGKYAVPITRYNLGTAPAMTDIRLLNGLALPFSL